MSIVIHSIGRAIASKFGMIFESKHALPEEPNQKKILSSIQLICNQPFATHPHTKMGMLSTIFTLSSPYMYISLMTGTVLLLMYDVSETPNSNKIIEANK